MTESLHCAPNASLTCRRLTGVSMGCFGGDIEASAANEDGAVTGGQVNSRGDGELRC